MQKYILMIKDMQCEHCKKTIENALSDAGINAEVNLNNKTVSVDRNGDNVTRAKRIIQEAGFTVL